MNFCLLSSSFRPVIILLERSTHFFFLEMGDRTDKVSTLRLKAAQTPADMEPAKPPRRGHPCPRTAGGGRGGVEVADQQAGRESVVSRAAWASVDQRQSS
jgi:hypothetical protein